MFERNRVTSGFDTETLVSESYITYLLLAQIEAGRLQLADIDAGEFLVSIHPPRDQDYQRLYDPDPSAPLPPDMFGSLGVTLLPDEPSPISTVAVHPSGLRIASGSWDGMTRIWSVETLADEVSFSTSGSSVSWVDFNPDGTRLAMCSVNGNVTVLDSEDGSELVHVVDAHSGPAFEVAFHPDGTLFASCGADNTIRLWDALTGEEQATLTGHNSAVLTIAISPDGSQLVSGSLDGNALLWTLNGNGEPTILITMDSAINSIRFHPDGMLVAFGSDDHGVHLIELETGNTISELSGNGGRITETAFSPDGTHMALSSSDGTVRIWNVSTGEIANTFRNHTDAVLSVAFSPDGTFLVSGSEDRNLLMWDFETADELARFNVEYLSIVAFITVTPNDDPNDEIISRVPVVLLFGVDLTSRSTNSGLEENHRLNLSFLRFSEETAGQLANFEIDIQNVEENLRTVVDRSVPLNLADGQQVQGIRMRKHLNESRSLGFYVNLALRDAPQPNGYLKPRGSLALAQDFRDPLKPLAFATSPGLFALLGPDAKFQQAEETEPGSGEYRYPLHKDFADPNSEVVGKIHGITIGPQNIQAGNQPPLPTGRLKIRIQVEYTDAPGNPDLTVSLLLDPKVSEGLVEWDIDVSVSGGLLLTFLFFVVGVILTSSPFFGAIIGIGVLQGIIAESLLARYIQENVDGDLVASLLDTLPFRVPATTRRWDPFYLTAHEIVALTDNVVIDDLGIAFEATELKLDKRPRLINHVVIRDEERSDEVNVTGLRYRVSDFPLITDDLSAIGPGADRMDYSETDELDILSLAVDQITERIDNNRLLAPIVLTPEKIQLVNNQIDNLLCLCVQERAERRRTTIDEFRLVKRDEIIFENGDEIRAQVSEELEESLGQAPTEAQIDEAFNRAVEILVKEQQIEFEETELPDRLQEAIDQILRFDLAPEELIELQNAGALFLDGRAGLNPLAGAPEIIVRNNADGSTTSYYRDHPDARPEDNLLSLPRYNHPYQPQ